MLSSILLAGVLSACDIFVTVTDPDPIYKHTNNDATMFRVTPGTYPAHVDLAAIILNQFGANYRIADWNDVFRFREDLENWINAVGLHDEERYFVTWAGDFPEGDSKYYFLVNDKDSTWSRKDHSLYPPLGLYVSSSSQHAHILAVHKSFPEP